VSPAEVVARLLNPVVLVTVALAGIAYGWWLWSLHIRPNATLYGIAVFPGVIFLVTIWAIRGLQGTFSPTYIAIMVNWLIFSNSGVLTVLAGRRWRQRR
jgi:hypothetical protein